MREEPLDFNHLAERGAPYRHFDAGEKVFLEDDLGSCLYYVRSGRIDIVSYGMVLENVEPGGIFGEMAMIDSGPRSAAAIAVEAAELVEIDRPLFLAILREKPEFALSVMQLLVDRIRRMNSNL